MPRIRSIKPETWTDPAFVKCSPLARLLWIGSWNLADDQGVLKDEPERLRLSILPGDQVDALALVEELVTERLLLRKLTQEGEPVLVIRTFREHQKIDQRRDGKWGDADALLDPGTLDEALLCGPSRPSALMRAGPRPIAKQRDHTIKEGIKDQGERETALALSIPSPFEVTDEMAEWANTEIAGDWRAATKKFVNWYKANGETRTDWVAAWKLWLLREREQVA